MAINIDNNLLIELGLGDIPAADKAHLLKQIQETLEMRVGMKIADKLDDAQLKQFEGFMESGDEAGAMEWLNQNYPDYRQVVQEELTKLKDEIRSDVPAIKKSLEA